MRTPKPDAAYKHRHNKGNKTEGACGTYGGQESSMNGSGQETWTKEVNWKT